MQTQILEQDAGRAKIKVEVPASDVSQTFQTVLGSIARQIRVPGFRPGKAPRGVIETRVGKDAIAQEVRDALVQTYFPQAVRELDLEPVAQHLHAHEPTDGQDYSFEAELELFPDFELPDPKEIVIDTEREPVTDEMVQESVNVLRTQNATLIPVERAAEPGDYLLVETVGAEGEEGSSIPVDLENVAPELAEQFLGRAIGEEIELTLSEDVEDEVAEEIAENIAEELIEEYGEDAPEVLAEALADAEAVDATVDTDADTDAGEAEAEPTTLRVIVRDIKAKERPDPDDEFAKTLGMETWAEVEAQVRRNLEAHLAQEAMSAQADEFTEKLVLETPVTVPPSLKARRKSSLLQNLSRELEESGGTLQGYLDNLDAEEGKRAEFERELDEAAEGAVKRDLVLERLLEVRGTKLSDEEFDAALAYTARQQNSTPQKLRQDLGESSLANYRFLLTRDKAVRESVQELLAAQSGEQSGEQSGDTQLSEQPAEQSAEQPDDSAADKVESGS